MEDSTSVSPLPGITSPFSFLPKIASAYDLASIFFTLLFILWAFFTIVSIYHWVRYGRHSWIAVPAIALHLFVSAALMLFATSGFK